MVLKKPKHVAESCKFLKYLIKSRVRLYFIPLFNYQTGPFVRHTVNIV